MEANKTSNDGRRKAYWQHAQKALKGEFHSFVDAVDSQSLIQQQMGRVARIEFQENGRTSSQSFQNSADLQTFFDSRSHHHKAVNSAICREIYILEDLGRANLEILGSRLRVPPAFFALHWDMRDVKVAAVDRNTLRLDRRQNFRLLYPVLHHFKIGNGDNDCPPGLYVDYGNNISRILQLLDEKRSMDASRHLVSFWSTDSAGLSWTGLLLVDPVMKEMQLENSPFEEVKAKLDDINFVPPILLLQPVNSTDNRSLFPRLVDFQPVSENETGKDNDISKPDFISMFDDLVHLYGNFEHLVDENPLSGTLLVHRYVVYLSNAWIESRAQEYWQLYNQLHLTSYSPRTTKSWFHSWDFSWRTEMFHRLTFGKFVIDSIGDNIKANMKVLGVGKSNSILEDEDAEAWEALSNSASSLQQEFSGLIAAYVQEASLHESRIANDQARNVGRLTSLATILVPISISAAIFSMGGDYLAGQSRFWIFWAVSLPIVLVFALLVFTRALQVLEVFWSGLARSVNAIRWGNFGWGRHRSHRARNTAA